MDSNILARVAVLEAYKEQSIADMHEVRTDVREVRGDVKAGNKLTTANLVGLCLALIGLVGILLTKH